MFGFEREVPEEETEKNTKVGILIKDDPPPQKKLKPRNGKDGENTKNAGAKDNQSNKHSGKQTLMSAPTKLQTSSKPKSSSKPLLDIQNDDEDGGRVYIPESIAKYDSDSDSFGTKLQKLNEGKNISKSNKQAMFVQIPDIILDKKLAYDSDMITTDKISNKTITHQAVVPDSPEIFLTDDNIIHSQGSQPVNEENQKEFPQGDYNATKTYQKENVDGMLVINEQEAQVGSKAGKENMMAGDKEGQPPQERRRSERLMKTSCINTSNKTLAEKKNLEGLFLETDKESVVAALDIVLAVASKLVADEKKRKHEEIEDGPEDS